MSEFVPARITITLARHGQADWTPEPDGTTVQDPDLTDLGRRQAEALARRLHGEEYDLFLVSPLARARQTAQPIADAIGMEPTVEEWLAELMIQIGGKSKAELFRFYRDARFRPPAEWYEGLGEAESFEHFHGRIVNGTDRLLRNFGATVELHDDHPVWRIEGFGGRVLIVAHGGTNGVLLTHLLGIDPVPWEWERFSMSLASVTRLHTVPLLSGSIWSLDSFSDAWHLQEIRNENPGPLDGVR